jgi:hypothetical protein
MALPARPDARLDRLARAQHGLVDISQHIDHALDRRQLAARVARGSLIRVDTGVYRTLGAPTTWEQRQLAACLASGGDAVASHRAAARLWGLAIPPEVVEVTVPYRRAPAPAGSVLHRSTDLRPGDVTRRRRIPVTNPIRTVGDLGAVAPDLVPGAIERGLVLGLFGLPGLWRLVDDLGRPGRRGIGVLRRALEDRALGDAPTRSVVEPVFAALADDTGLAVEYQHRVHVDGAHVPPGFRHSRRAGRHRGRRARRPRVPGGARPRPRPPEPPRARGLAPSALHSDPSGSPPRRHPPTGGGAGGRPPGGTRFRRWRR